MAAQGNIYSANREEAFARFGERLAGSEAGLVLIAFTQELAPEAREALDKSFAALGFGREACTYAKLEGLEPQDVFALVEGIDPLCLVAADAQAATLCSQAVRQDFPLKRALRLFGREARGFASINDMMAKPEDKQLLWHLLKSLA